MASVVIRGHAFIQSLRRGHDGLAVDIGLLFRLATAFDEFRPPLSASTGATSRLDMACAEAQGFTANPIMANASIDSRGLFSSPEPARRGVRMAAVSSQGS